MPDFGGSPPQLEPWVARDHVVSLDENASESTETLKMDGSDQQGKSWLVVDDTFSFF